MRHARVRLAAVLAMLGACVETAPRPAGRKMTMAPGVAAARLARPPKMRPGIPAELAAGWRKPNGRLSK
ncbi:MAG: hypothetical protein JNM66_00405 [Bryobacterales bacterium]|nr:hypothetical protein [Bryobacterales bacterium]